MSRRAEAILVGVGTVLAIAGLLAAGHVGTMTTPADVAGPGGVVGGPDAAAWFWRRYGLHALAALWVLGMVGYYLHHLLKRNTRVSSATVGVLWSAALVLLNVAAMPIYWLVYLWPDVASDPSAAEPNR